MPTAHFDTFTPELTSPDDYEHVNVDPILDRITGDVMGVRWLREDGTWKIIRIEDIAYLEEILDDRMSFAAYQPSALKYLNDTNRIITWDKAVNMIMGQIVLLTKEPEPVSTEGGYPLMYRPFVYPWYSGQYVKELELADITGMSRDSLNKVVTDDADAGADPENGAKAKVIRTIRDANYLTTPNRSDTLTDSHDRWKYGYRIANWTIFSLLKDPNGTEFRIFLAEQILRWYAFIQQMSIFIGADSNLSDENTFKELLPSFEQNQQLVDSWHDNTKLVPAQKFERDGSSSFVSRSVMEPIRFIYSRPRSDKETFYIYQEPYRIYMNPRYTGRIAEIDAFVFLQVQSETDGNWISVVRVPMIYSGTETDIFGNGTESEVWALPMYLNNTLFFQKKINTGESISTDMSPLYMIRLSREKGKRRYAFQAFVLVEWEKSDVDICAFWSGWDSTKYVGFGWGSSQTLQGFSSTWNSSDNTQGGPEYISIAYDSDEPPPNSSSFEVHLNWYTYTSGEKTAKVTCYDQFGGMRTATILPSVHKGKTQPDDPGVRFNFDSAGNVTSASAV